MVGVVVGKGGLGVGNHSVSKNCLQQGAFEQGSKNKNHFNGATSVVATRLRSQTPAATADTRAQRSHSSSADRHAISSGDWQSIHWIPVSIARS